MRWALVALLLCANAIAQPRTTSGAIAVANLDHRLAQAHDAPERIELLLMRARFLADHEALEEAVTLVEGGGNHRALVRAAQAATARQHETLRSRPEPAPDLIREPLPHQLVPRVLAAAHRFDEALAVLSDADTRDVAAMRAGILVAVGRAADALPALESAGPGYASHAARAAAYAELGRYGDADRAYRDALAALRTTSPFPYAWIHFARGVMWSEQAGDPRRGEADYDAALAYLPQFAVAHVHKAEREMSRGAFDAAVARLEPIAARGDPEALALLGETRLRMGDADGQRDVEAAARRYEELLERQPLAYADHAAEFYLGRDPERASRWARRNLEVRRTRRAVELELRARAGLPRVR